MLSEFSSFIYSPYDTTQERREKYKFWKKYYYFKNNKIFKLSFKNYAVLESVIVTKKNVFKNTKQYFQYCYLFQLKPISSFIEIEEYTKEFERNVKIERLQQDYIKKKNLQTTV